MENITRKSKSEDLTAFSIACNEAVEAIPKPTRSHRRRLEAFRSKLESMLKDPELRDIAENRLQVLDAVLDYARTGSETSFERSMQLHQEGDAIINSRYEKE